jgi:DNA helicase-2/ATP-dependent DNA helicase PcrA
MRQIQLSEEQLAAVAAQNKAMVLTAGAGSGKTEVVAQRVERLLENSVQHGTKVLAVTYTVKAAGELRNRFAETLMDLKDRADVNTIHGFCMDTLKSHGHLLGWSKNPDVLSRNEDRQSLFTTWLKETGQEIPEQLGTLFMKMDLARATRNIHTEDNEWIPNWKLAMESYDSIDFPEMLDRAIELLKDPWMISFIERVYSDVIIDEAQNLTEAQYELIRALIGESESQRLSTMFVGDQRQSIVSFAGADPLIMDRFASDYSARKFALTVNFRSASLILALGQRVALKMNLPVDTNDGNAILASGRIEVASFEDEATEGSDIADLIRDRIRNGLNPSICGIGEDTSLQAEQIGVLARSAASLRYVKESLIEKGILVSTASTEDEWVSSLAAKCVIAWISSLAEPEHHSRQRYLGRLLDQDVVDSWSNFAELFGASPDHSIQQLSGLDSVSTPNELSKFLNELRIDDPSWTEDVEQIQSAIHSFGLFANNEVATLAELHGHLIRIMRGDSQGPGVRLLTIHKSQGQEFRLVVVIGMNEGQFPDFRAKTVEQHREELRTFYVAVSRPSRELVLSRARKRETKYGPRGTDASQFLAFAEVTP